MFRVFLAFLAFAKVEKHQVNVNVLLAFLECLVVNNIKHSQLLNYLSAIKTLCVICEWKIPDLKHEKIHFYLKSIQKTSPFSVKMHSIIDTSLLSDIVSTCRLTFLGDVFKAVYLTAFFGFFRLSNLVPHTISTFSLMKHLTRGDIFFSQKFVIILIKWSKPMQNNNQARLIKLPLLNNHLCPFLALKRCLQIIPGSKNDPLFQFKSGSIWLPLTDNRVRSHLKNVLSLLNLPPAFITFHSFRRSGATFAFNHNVSLQEIQRHGTWTSDCVWRYVCDSMDAGSAVASTFASLLS